MRFLLLDDHPAILALVSNRLRGLNEAWESILCRTQEEALAVLKSQKVDRAWLDLHLEEGKSLDIPRCCDALGIPYGVYSSYQNPAVLKQLTALNHAVFVVKSAPMEELDLGLNALAEGKRYACSRTQKCLLTSQEALDDNPLEMPQISEAEKKVLEQYMQGRSTREIAKFLRLSPVTVQNHKARMVQRNKASLPVLLQRYLFWTQP